MPHKEGEKHEGDGELLQWVQQPWELMMYAVWDTDSAPLIRLSDTITMLIIIALLITLTTSSITMIYVVNGGGTKTLSHPG